MRRCRDHGEISILAHLDGHGDPTATIYTNDNSAPLPGAARVSVRHAAQAPAVQLAAGGVPKLAVTNPYFGDLEVPGGVAIPLQLQVPFTGAAITPTATLSFNAGRALLRLRHRLGPRRHVRLHRAGRALGGLGAGADGAGAGRASLVRSARATGSD